MDQYEEPVTQKESATDDDTSNESLPVDPHHPQTQDGLDLTEPLNTTLTNSKSSDVLTVLAAGYGSSIYTSSTSTRISNSLTVGTILGQVFVGIICDRIGRKTAIVTSTLLLALGAIFATAASPIHGSTTALFWWLTVARGAAGVGVGGEYPSSSTSASEAANEKYGKQKRSTIFILCTNVVLSMGGPIASSFFLIVLSITNYGNTKSASDLRKLDIVWRLCYGFGALLPLSVFYFRWRLMNSKLYRASAIRNNVPYWLFLRRYWLRLIGTAGAWFMYDFVAFSSSAFSSTIISTILNKPTLLRTAEYQLLLGAIALPGAFLGAFTIQKIGAKNQMLIGFAGYIVIGLIVGCLWFHIKTIPVLFVILYGLLASVGNFGPGSVLGLTSSESYPTALRGSAYGLSAAVGKTGAVVGTEVFKPVEDHIGVRYVFIIAAGIGVLGCLLTFFFIPDTTKFDLAAEDEAWRQYLLAHGWDGYMGDGTTKSHKASEVLDSLGPHVRLEDEEPSMAMKQE